MFIIGVAIAAGLAGASITAGIAGGAASAIMSNKSARRNRKFQERMAKTKYQYTMEDMRKAGLNPILAYKQGAGAIPTGATAQVPMDLGATAARAVESGTKSGVNLQQRKLMGEQTSAARAQAAASTAIAENQSSQANLNKADLPAALVRSNWAGTPEGQAALEAREIFGGKGFWPGMAGAAGYSAKAAQKPRSTPILKGRQPWSGKKGKRARTPYGDNTRKPSNKWGGSYLYPYKGKR